MMAPAPGRTMSTDMPYGFLLTNLAIRIIGEGGDHGLAGEVDFYFDEQSGFEEEVKAFWPLVLESAKTLPPSIPLRFARSPNFKPDSGENAFLPLQAADLIAWSTRRALDPSDRGYQMPLRTRRILKKIGLIRFRYTPALLKSRRAAIRASGQRLLAQGVIDDLVHFDEAGGPRVQKRDRVKGRTRRGIKAASAKKKGRPS